MSPHTHRQKPTWWREGGEGGSFILLSVDVVTSEMFAKEYMFRCKIYFVNAACWYFSLTLTNNVILSVGYSLVKSDAQFVDLQLRYELKENKDIKCFSE